jgi:hypothetical protein
MGGRGGDLLEVVGDEDSGEIGLGFGEGGEGGEQGLAGEEVETCGGFVEEQEGRVSHEGAGDADALALALRAGGDFAAFEVGATEEVEEFFGAAAFRIAEATGLAGDGVGGAGHDDLFDGVPLVDGLGGVDDADALAEFPEIGLTEAGAEDGDGALAGEALGSGEGEQGGFAGAVGAEECPMFAALDGPGDAVEDAGAVVDPDVGVFYCEDWCMSVVHTISFIDHSHPQRRIRRRLSPERGCWANRSTDYFGSGGRCCGANAFGYARLSRRRTTE